MPMYTYRREDGTTFDIRQKFLDDPLTVDPTTGQRVVRVVYAAGIIFKGSGFYVNDSKNASNSAMKPPHSATKEASASGEAASTPAKAETKSAETTPAPAPKAETKSAAD
jgi:predicted nucleic acid-binding Zn ribbon protein